MPRLAKDENEGDRRESLGVILFSKIEVRS